MKFQTMIMAVLAIVNIQSSQASTQVTLYGDRTILRVGAYVSGGYIQFSPALSGAEGCPTQDHLWIEWGSQPDGKALYATVLAAHLAGQKMTFGVSGCSSGGHPLVYRVDIVS